MPDGPVDCRSTWIRQEGEMRFAPNRPWLPFRAVQWFLGNGIDFRWEAQVRMAPMLRARVVDSFMAGRGSLVARVFGLIPLARSTGPATDKAEAMRGLAELPWRPYAFREGFGLTWEAVEPDTLRAIFDDGQTRAMVEFEVGSDGQVLGAWASDRPRIAGNQVVETAWLGSFSDYVVFDGVRVPTVAEVSWDAPEGRFTYWRGRVAEFRAFR